MKFTLLLCAGLCFVAFAHAQTVKNIISPDTLKVTLSKDRLFIIYKNQEIPAANNRGLDSLLKKIPVREHLTVEFESRDAEPEIIRSIDSVLKRCYCHVSKHSIKQNRMQ
jgi:hypothetical protein